MYSWVQSVESVLEEEYLYQKKFLFYLWQFLKTIFCISVTAKDAPCVTSYIGDGYCDDDNNNDACQFDGGDCCDQTTIMWNSYCYVSKF